MVKKAKVAKPPKKTSKKAKETPPKSAAPAANAPVMDPKLRELALFHRDKYLRLHKTLSTAQANMRLLGKEVKEDGFSMRQIRLMVELSTPEGEQAWRMTIANDLIAAQYQGAGIGQQLVLFLEPDRTPSVDVAFDEGQRDSMEGKPPKPRYDPSVPQYQRYLDGFHDHNGKMAMEGIKPTGFIPMTSEELSNQQAEAEKASGPRTTEMASRRAAAVTDKPAGNA